MAILLVFLPVLLLLLMANLGESHSGWRSATFLVLWVVDGFVVLAGLAMSLSGTVPLPPELEPKIGDLDLVVGGWVLLIGGMIALLLMPKRARRLFALKGLGFHPESSVVHAVSLEMAWWLLVVGVAQWLMLRNVSNLLETVPPVSLLQIVLQGVVETVVAFVGVGWLIRRSTSESLARLGLYGIKKWHWLAALVALGAMYSMNLLYGLATVLSKSGGLGEIGKINQTLLGNLMSPWGALVVGLSAGIGEELIFRGAVQERMGIVTAALLFAVLHTQYSFSLGIVVVFVIGLILGYLRKYTSVSVSILTHATYNFIGIMLMVLSQSIGK